MKSVGVGIITYNRPRYLSASLRGAAEHLSKVADVYVYNDGSDDVSSYRRVYERWRDRVEHIEHAEKNRGVAAAKNCVLQTMLDRGHTYLFTLEDDIVPKSPEAVTGYIEAAEASGWHHLNFHAHGPGNRAPIRIQGRITYWPHLVGAYSFFTDTALRTAGLLDENFYNAWEHIEHYFRIEREGLASPLPGAADATGSERWLAEIPGSSTFKNRTTSFPDTQAWLDHVEKQFDYWREKYARDGVAMPIALIDGSVRVIPTHLREPPRRKWGSLVRRGPRR